jgi:LPS-assembly lipoprotein
MTGRGNLLRLLRPLQTAAVLVVVVAAVALAGCGFHLRGEEILPFDTLYIAIRGDSQLGANLRRAILAGSKTRIVEKESDAQATLQVIGEQREKIILSLNSAGRVNEFLLRYRFVFKVRDSKGRDFLPQGEIVLTRELLYSDTEVLAKETEEQLLYRDMQRDMVQQILRRLAAAKLPTTPAPEPS